MPKANSTREENFNNLVAVKEKEMEEKSHLKHNMGCHNIKDTKHTLAGSILKEFN